MTAKVASSNAEKLPKGSNTKQYRAGLTFPVARFMKKLRMKKITKNIAADSPIFVAGVVESIIMSIMADAATHAHNNKSARLNLKDLIAAVRQNPDVSRLFADFAFSSGSVCPKAMNHILPHNEQVARATKMRQNKINWNNGAPARKEAAATKREAKKVADKAARKAARLAAASIAED